MFELAAGLGLIFKGIEEELSSNLFSNFPPIFDAGPVETEVPGGQILAKLEAN